MRTRSQRFEPSITSPLVAGTVHRRARVCRTARRALCAQSVFSRHATLGLRGCIDCNAESGCTAAYDYHVPDFALLDNF